MYGKIYVPLDNSDHSNAAIEVAVRLAGATQARVVGSHVYAARMHDVRFKQMEYTLPEEYQHEQELERQRKIHDSLITRGLQLISDSYLDVMKVACDQAGLPFEYKTLGSMIPWKVLALMFYTLIAIAAVVWYLRGLPGVVWGTARRGKQRILMLAAVLTMLMIVTMGFIRENSRAPFLISGEMTIQGQQNTAQPTPSPQTTP